MENINEEPFKNIGLKQLKIQREERIKKWEKSGLLDSLSTSFPPKENIALLYEAKSSCEIKDHELEDFDCLIGNEDDPKTTEDELAIWKEHIEENHKNRTPERKIKNELYSLYYKLEDTIKQKAIDYSENIPSLCNDEKKAIGVDFTEGAYYILKELKKIINNIDK